MPRWVADAGVGAHAGEERAFQEVEAERDGADGGEDDGDVEEGDGGHEDALSGEDGDGDEVGGGGGEHRGAGA